ncbi:MAG: hypothetical protein ACJA1C_002191 [Crocinitomicaceae bacterium]|jgi:hypothetical protein
MKGLKLLFSVLIALSVSNFSNAEITVSINEFPNAEGENMLFRGYSNVLEITTTGEEIEYTIENFNLKTSQVAPSDNPNVKRYWITVGTEKTASISFIKKGEKEPFLTVNCRVGNLPNAILSLGGVEDGGIVSKSASSFSVGVPKGVRIIPHYSVLGASIGIGERTEASASPNLSDSMKALLVSGKSGDEVVVICTVQSSDGISRHIPAAFTLE